MAKNIEMNWFNGSEYEVLYPYTTMELVENLQTTIDSTYENLLNTINNKGINYTVLTRRGTNSTNASVVLPFTPKIILCRSLNIGERNTSLGIWFDNQWATSSGSLTAVFSASISSTNVMSWSWGGGHGVLYLNDSQSYKFLLIP